MKLIKVSVLFIALLMCFITSNGQNLHQLKHLPSFSHFNEAELIQSTNIEEKLISKNESKIWTIYTSKKFYKGVELYNSCSTYLVSVNDQSIIEASPQNSNSISGFDLAYQNERTANIIDSLALQLKIISSTPVFYFSGKRHQMAVCSKYQTSDNGDFEIVVDLNNQVLEHNDLLLYHQQANDTLIQVNIFDPDPLTSSNTLYGDSASDNNDQSNTFLENQMTHASLLLDIDSTGTVLSSNKFITLRDFSTPAVPIFVDTAIGFLFNRSQSSFEDFNVLYHITNFNQWLGALGYNHILNYQIEVDPHGFNGADNSAFSYLSSPKNLIFGEGGVDDAEDADVIIHEFVHAVFDAIAPDAHSGNELRAIQEATSDVFAVNYSRAIDPFNWHNVFSWDGHNEFWPGRIANSQKKYSSLSGSFYSDAEIWSGCMTNLYNYLGRDNLEIIMLEAIYGASNNMTMPDMAALMLEVDKQLYSGVYHDDLCSAFIDRGFFSICPVTIDNIAEVNSNSNLFSSLVINKNLVISNLETKNNILSVVDVFGKVLVNKRINQNSITIPLHNLQTGVYIINANGKSQKLVFLKH
tara:strand:- start:983 stop:2725 length:1743 start_codon:yes stop_codon:yes gene_type:complete